MSGNSLEPVEAVDMTPERLAAIEAAGLEVALNAALAVLQPVETLTLLAAEVRRLQAAVERVRALHYQYVDSSGALRPECECGDRWPCPTIAALDGDGQ